MKEEPGKVREAFVKNSQRRNIQDENNQIEVLEPVMTAAPTLSLRNDRIKIHDDKSKEDDRPKEKMFPSYGKKFPYHKNSTAWRKSNKKILKKRLRLDTENKDKIEEPVLKREHSIFDLFDNGKNDLAVGNSVKYPEDQLAQEATENNSVLQPVNRLFAESDDVIYKQMNFWRNRMESKRLEDFLLPNERKEIPKQNDIKRILKNTIIKLPNNNRRTLSKKLTNNKMFEDDLNAEKIDTTGWHPNIPRNIEQVITDELREIQETLMVTEREDKMLDIHLLHFQAQDWTPLREVPKILGDSPNIYSMNTNSMKDLMTRVDRVENVGTGIHNVLESVNMTARPDLQETITRSRVESSLSRPDIVEKFKEPEDRLFYKSNTREEDVDDIGGKVYDYNVMSKDPADVAQERSVPVNSEDFQLSSQTEQSFKIDAIAEENEDVTTSSPDEDVIPMYLHIPRTSGCRKFCISINVEITRTGRQIKTKCRKSLVCKTNVIRNK